MPNSPLSTKRFAIGMAYAATQVNATVFRVSAVVSGGGYQYATYYAPDGSVVVAQRRPPSTHWDIVTLPFKGNVADAHNDVLLGISGDGILHLSYDHHAQPIHYRRTSRPHDPRSFGDAIPMTGRNEAHVTYPQFINAPDGTLLYFYRDGASGNGNLCLNRYTPGRGWRAMYQPLIDGQGQRNPYWWRPAFGADNSLHLAWCWRDSGDARTNHDICYMRSTDGGATFTTPEGHPQALPVNLRNAYVADPVPTGSNLINQCSSTVDSQGRPHLAHYQSDPAGIPQYVHLYWDGSRWVRQIVSRRTARFTLGGGGTLKIPISRPEIAISRSGNVYLITRDESLGGGIRLYRSSGKNYESWDPIDITPGLNLGEWEPTYDTERLRQTGILSLFVLNVQQGNHETTTNLPPQECSLLELELP